MKTKSLRKNSVYYVVYNLLNVLFPFITSLYAARVLLPQNIGEVAFAQNIVQYFVILAFLGIPTYGLREISKVRNNPSRLNTLFSELVIINTISTIVFSVVYFGMIIIVPQFFANLKLFLIVGISLLLNFINISWLFEGLEEFGIISLRNLLFKIASFVLLIVFVRKESDYYIFALISVVGTAGNYLFNVFVSRKYVKFSFRNISLAKHLKPILFLVVVNIAIEIYTLVDTTMIGFLCEKSNVAFYSYGSKINKIFLGIFNSLTIVLVPRIAFLKNENQTDEFNRLVSKVFKILCLLSIPCCIGIHFTSNYLIKALFGNSYSSSVDVLNILSFNLIISPLSYLLGSRIMLVNNKEKQMALCVGIGAVANILLNTVLIKLYAEKGAALASVFSEIIVLIIYLSLSHKYFKLQELPGFFIKLILSVCIMTAFLVCISMHDFNTLLKTIVQITGSILIYFSILVFVKEENTVSFLKSLILKFKKKTT